jgi:hypothetical protein
MKVGDKVVCIRSGVESPTTKGEEYVVTRVFRWFHITGLYFSGTVNSSDCFNGHDSVRFRKLETYKTTINEVNFNAIEEGLELTPELV